MWHHSIGWEYKDRMLGKPWYVPYVCPFWLDMCRWWLSYASTRLTSDKYGNDLRKRVGSGAGQVRSGREG